MARVVLKLIRFLPLALAAVLTNVVVDPANLLHSPERALVVELLEGRAVAIRSTDLDERRLQKGLIQGRRVPPELVVIGSSRAMQVRADCFPGLRFFNHSVSGATLEDMMAIYEACRDRDARPSALVLGCDPWLLNTNNGQPRWKSLWEDYDRAASRLGIHRSYARSRVDRLQPERWLQFASPRYFQVSLKYVLRRQSRADPPNLLRTILPDGSTAYPGSHATRTIEQVRELAREYIEKEVYALEDFRRLDAPVQGGFERFLDGLRADEVKVTLLLSPYHPLVYGHLAGDPRYRKVLEAEAWFREVAARKGLSLVGSYDPEALGCSEADFSDGMHSKEGVMRRLLHPSYARGHSQQEAKDPRVKVASHAWR